MWIQNFLCWCSDDCCTCMSPMKGPPILKPGSQPLLSRQVNANRAQPMAGPDSPLPPNSGTGGAPQPITLPAPKVPHTFLAIFHLCIHIITYIISYIVWLKNIRDWARGINLWVYDWYPSLPRSQPAYIHPKFPSAAHKCPKLPVAKSAKSYLGRR